MNFLPPNGALHGVALDRLLSWNLAAVFWLFVAAQVLLVLALLRRPRNRSSRTPRAAAKAGRALLILDYAALLALTILYIAMDVTGHRLWAASREQPGASQAVKVEVTGVQFQWYFRYPGADGLYGATKPTLVSAPTGNPDRKSVV